jgi:hypothetical protein
MWRHLEIRRIGRFGQAEACYLAEPKEIGSGTA